MANGGGNFGGDGSVVWEVTTKKDAMNDSHGNPRKKVEQAHGSGGKRNAGIDEDSGTYFVILLKLDERTLIDMVKHEGIDRIRIRVPIQDIPKQIEIHWNKEFPGTEHTERLGTA